MADIQLIQELADSALEDWKDELPHWDWQWNNNTSRHGVCKCDRQTIFLSLPWTKKVSDDEAWDTFLHELAHAIAFTRYGMAGGGHGVMWKIVCKELGALPEVLSRSNVKLKDLDMVPKWSIKCMDCKVITPYYRKPKRDISRYACVLCQKSKGTNGRLVLIKNR